MKIAFDVDGTLIKTINGVDHPRLSILEMLRTLAINGHEIIVWSGGGREYAELWVRRLFLTEFVKEAMEKPIHRAAHGDGPFVDIAFDDEDVTFGTVNVKLV